MGNRCDGKPQVLLHPVVENHFTLHNGQPGIIFTTSEKVSRIGLSTQDSSILQREKMQDFSLTTGPTFPHTPNVQYLNVTAVTLQPPNRGELGDLPPTPETQELQARGELGDLLSKDQIKDNPPNQDHMDFPPLQLQEGDKVPILDNPPNQDNRDFPPSISRRKTRSPSRTIHPIRTTGTPPQHFQEGDKVPIPDNPPNQDNRDFPSQHFQEGDKRDFPPPPTW